SPIPASEGERGGSVWRIRPVVPEPLEVERETTSIRDLEKELLRTVFANAPAFMAAFSGPDHVFELVNNTYCAYTGRQQSELLGQPLRCAIAELAEQGFIDVLDRVYRTGEPCVMNETPVCLDATPLAP